MLKKKKGLSWLIALIIVVVIVWGVFLLTFQKSEKSNKLQVALIIPLTGSSSPEGQDLLNGLMLAKEKIRPRVDLYIEDSQGDATEGITAAKRILDTKNIDVIISFQSAVSIPLLEIADQYNKPLIATAVAQNEFTNKSKNAFRLFPTARQYSTKVAEFANKNQFKKVSTLTIHDEYGESIKNQFKKIFTGSIPHEESFEVPEKDFRTILTKVSDSEVVYSVGYNIHWVNLFKQREELRKNITFISNQNMVSSFVKSQVGDLLTNAYAAVPPSVLFNNETRDFFNEYKAKYNKESDWVAPFGYDILLILDAAQKNGKDPIEALHEIKISGINGDISFDEKGESNISLVIIRAEKGVVEAVE